MQRYPIWLYAAATVFFDRRWSTARGSNPSVPPAIPNDSHIFARSSQDLSQLELRCSFSKTKYLSIQAALTVTCAGAVGLRAHGGGIAPAGAACISTLDMAHSKKGSRQTVALPTPMWLPLLSGPPPWGTSPPTAVPAFRVVTPRMARKRKRFRIAS